MEESKVDSTATASPEVLPNTPSRNVSSNSVEAFKRLTEPSGNIFVNNTWHWSWSTILRYTVIGAVLVPIRMAGTLINLMLLMLIARIGTLGMRRQDYDTPMVRWRRVILSPIRYLLRLQLFLFGYHWITIRGRPASKSEAQLITPNHITFLEPIFLMYYCGGTPVAAIENASLPLIGNVFKALQTMFVQRDRSRRNAANTSSTAADIHQQILQRAKDTNFPQVLIFPEGTCTNGTAVISFKTGAFNPGLPVQPVAISYFHRHCDPSWVSGGQNLYVLLLRLMCQVHNFMEVRFLPVYRPSAREIADPRLFAWNVQRNIALALKVRTTNHSYEDVMLAAVARKAHYPVDRAVVEFQAMRKVLDIDTKTAEAYLKRFIKMDKAHTGKINYEQFRQIFATARTNDSPTGANFAATAAHTNTASTEISSPVEVITPPAETLANTDASNTTAAAATAAASVSASAPMMKSPPRYTTDEDRRIARTFSLASAKELEAENAPVATASGDVVGVEEELMRLFELLDVDEDGVLDFRELLFGLAVINDRGNKHVTDTLALAFRLLDTERKGKITRMQLERALRKVWPELDETSMDSIFAEADADKDGLIGLSEFVTWASNHQEHLPQFRQTFFGFKDEPALFASLATDSTKMVRAV